MIPFQIGASFFGYDRLHGEPVNGALNQYAAPGEEDTVEPHGMQYVQAEAKEV